MYSPGDSGDRRFRTEVILLTDSTRAILNTQYEDRVRPEILGVIPVPTAWEGGEIVSEDLNCKVE